MRKGYHVRHQHRHMLGYFLIGMALLWLVGFKGLLFPVLFFGAMWFFWSRVACGWHWESAPDEKAKNDDSYDWDGDYI